MTLPLAILLSVAPIPGQAVCAVPIGAPSTSALPSSGMMGRDVFDVDGRRVGSIASIDHGAVTVVDGAMRTVVPIVSFRFDPHGRIVMPISETEFSDGG